MIYCNLKGGLGNMLFQIAATTSFAKDCGTEASFPNILNHLNYLNMEMEQNPTLNHSLEYLDFLSPLLSESPSRPLPTIGFPFHYERKSPPSDCWIDGYFQSEKYFIHNRADVLALFREADSTSKAYEKYFKKDSGITISIHVRRGDYLKFPQHHPIAPVSYYEEAIKKMGAFDRALVFSDDVEWCKATFRDPRFIFPQEKDYVELFLMSKCDKHIVANSSFSWWGAWLSNTSQVITPKIHLGVALSNLKDSDIHPKSWIKI